jgi:ribosome maturation factor RimP
MSSESENTSGGEANEAGVQLSATSSTSTSLEPFIVSRTGVTETLRGIIEPSVDARGVELVEIFFVRGKTHSKLRIFVDMKETPGIGLADLEGVNRTLSDLLDVEDAHLGLFATPWDLEVSSPGVDRPLTKRSHFGRVKGERVKVRTKVPVDGSRQLVGVLEDSDDRGLTILLDEGKKSVRVDFDIFDTAHVIFNFGSPGKPSGSDAARRKGWKAKS